jgi:hypothetical protein
MDKRKHLPFKFYDEKEEKFIKEKARYYKSRSPLHYETFKRTITFYKLSGRMESVLEFECNFSMYYDTIEDTLYRHEFEYTFSFKKKLLNPRVTSRVEFEIELENYLAKRNLL